MRRVTRDPSEISDSRSRGELVGIAPIEANLRYLFQELLTPQGIAYPR